MYKILKINKNSIYLEEIYSLLKQYGKLIYSEKENPVLAFQQAISKQNIIPLVGLKNEKLIAFGILYNFQLLSDEYFSCYIYGGAQPKQAKNLKQLLKLLFYTLKEKGCKIIRFETREYNLPMRSLATRLGFRKVGYLGCSHFKNGKFFNNILYEKQL